MQKCYQLIVFIVFYVIFAASQAEIVKNLNVGVVVVPNRTQAALQKVAPAALQQVLVKMSGNPSVGSIPEVQLAVSQQAGQFIQSFGYSQQPSDQPQLLVSIRFDQHAISQLLQQAKQARWRADRPVTLAWVNLDQDDNNPNTIVSSGNQTSEATSLTSGADAMGLPLILPAMDLQDQGYVNQNSDMPFDMKKLLVAGKRYHVNSILAGNLSTAVDGSWQGQWMYLLNGTAHQWESVGPTPQAVIQQAVVNMDSVMSGMLAVRDNINLQSSVSLQIVGVTDLRDYALVMNDLHQMTVVAHIAVAQLDGATMMLRLHVVGGEKALQSALAHNSDLTQVPQPLLQNTQAAGLFYQFNTDTGVSS